MLSHQPERVTPWAAQMVNYPARELPTTPGQARRAPTRAFWGSCFTDDVALLLHGVRAAVVGTQVWDRTCYRCNIRMTDFEKRKVSTAPLHIGARFVLNAHFGCVPPVKRARCLFGIRAALEQRALRDEFESNCGLIGHVAQTLDLDRSLLHGIKRPLYRAATDGPTSIIFLTDDGRTRHLELECLISSRNAASFATAVLDAALAFDLPRRPSFSPVEVRMGSDACTHSDGVARPAVFGMCHEFAYVFHLTGRWLEVPITGTESLGAILNFLVFPPLFPWARMVNETDASSAHALVLGRSKSPPLQRAYRVLRSTPAFQEAMPRSANQLVAGEQHVMVDAGSRGYQDVLAGWLAALNMRIRFIVLSQATIAIVEQVLEAMLDGDPVMEDFTRDVEGGVAFYSPHGESIRFVLHVSPTLPLPPKRRAPPTSGSPGVAPPSPPSSPAVRSPALPNPSSPMARAASPLPPYSSPAEPTASRTLKSAR